MKILFTLLLLIPYLSWGGIKSSEHFDAWHSNIQVDDFDSTESYYSRTFGDKDSSLVIDISSNPDYDLVREIYISPKDYVCGNEDDSDYVTVSLRVDDNKVITEDFSLSNNKQFLSNWEDDFIKELVTQMKKGMELKIRIFDEICGDINDYKFSLIGFSKSLDYWENKFPKTNLGDKLLSLKSKVYNGEASIEELLLLENNDFRIDSEYRSVVDANLARYYLDKGNIDKAEMSSFGYVTDMAIDLVPYNNKLFIENFDVLLEASLALKDKMVCSTLILYRDYKDTDDFMKSINFPEETLKKLSKITKELNCN